VTIRDPERIDLLDAAPDEAAQAMLAPLFEAAPRFVARLATAKPFRRPDRVWARAREIAHAMPDAEQVELLDAHARLGAPRETVSTLSRHEQGYDRPSAGGAASEPTGETIARLAHLNAAYEARFGFRYCVFVAGRPLDVLIPEFEAALAADRATELHRGLDAVVDIARARFGDGATRPVRPSDDR